MKRFFAFALIAICGAANSVQAAIDFANDIKPILETRCLRCHGPEKQKGKLRLDQKEVARRTGEGAVIVPGNADQSELVRLISLPKGDDDIMPNEGEPLTKAQIESIRTWINEGAHWPDGLVLKDASATAPAAAAPAEAPLPTDFKPSANEAKAVAALSKLGVEVRPIAMNVPWTEANFRLLGSNVTDAAVAPLKDVTSLVDLNLATTKITDAGLASIKTLTNLGKLHLELTAITDRGLANLKGLPRLSYLNLYGTPVTDAGLEHLKDLKSLRRLYVWQTKVTEGGVANLKKALPNVEVVTGWDLQASAKQEEKKEEKK
jgi:hypothetical protein